MRMPLKRFQRPLKGALHVEDFLKDIVANNKIRNVLGGIVNRPWPRFWPRLWRGPATALDKEPKPEYTRTPGGARRSQEEPGGARRRQGKSGGARRNRSRKEAGFNVGPLQHSKKCPFVYRDRSVLFTGVCRLYLVSVGVSASVTC